MDFDCSTTLILGARGLIGSACHRKYPHALTPSREELDLLNRESVVDYFHKHHPCHVILAVGMVGGIEYNRTFPADFILKNLKIQLNVFEAAEEMKVERLIFFASSCIYPKNAPQPIKEECFLTGMPELTSLSYAVAKIAGVQMAWAMNEQFHSNRFAVLIPNTVYGPNDDFNPKTGHVISSLITKFHRAKEEGQKVVSLWGSGNAKREFIYSDDVANGVDLILRQSSFPLLLNLGSGIEISIRELVELIVEIVGYDGKCEWDLSKSDGSSRKFLDSSHISALGFSPSTSLLDGLRRAYDFYLSQVPFVMQ